MEDFCAERMEPALEPCMKVQRRTGVNGEKERADRASANKGGTAEGEIMASVPLHCA